MKSCEEFGPLLMGWLDGELPEDLKRLVEAHLAVCAACRADEEAFRRLGEMTENIELYEPTEAEWRRHWTGIYHRLERGAGWVLLSLGMLLLLLYGLWVLAADFLLDAALPLPLRLGVGLATAGAVVLAVSVIRERVRLRRVDRYEEVEL